MLLEQLELALDELGIRVVGGELEEPLVGHDCLLVLSGCRERLAELDVAGRFVRPGLRDALERERRLPEELLCPVGRLLRLLRSTWLAEREVDRPTGQGAEEPASSRGS